MTHRIVFLDRDSVPAEVPRPAFCHEWREYGQTAPEDIVERLAGASIAISNKVALRADTLTQLPALKMIAIAATGSDNVDLDYCRANGIVVSNVRGYAGHAVPEHVMSLMLALRRNLLAYRADIRGGRWQRCEHFCFADHPIRDLAGATLAIVGNGALGQGVAALGRAFGMQVIQVERKGATEVRPGYVPFEAALAQAEVISLHCPLTPATRQFIGAAELELMQPGTILINTARGALVDESALASALRAGRIAAGLDVLSREPPDADNPLLAPDLLDLPNYILTPHVAWASGSAVAALVRQLIDNIQAFAAGQPRNTL